MNLELTPAEVRILKAIREVRPFEEVRIQKDQLGKPDHFFIVRSQKLVITNEELRIEELNPGQG